ncbi:MAG: sugar phosphate isomerase/epimerase family protein, partial [Phycisphaerae bacterium]
ITLINLTTTVVQNDNAQTHDLDRHGSAAANETQWDKLVTGLRQAIDVAAEHGIRISLEIHGKYIHDTAQSTLRVIERVGRDTLGITLDPGNMVLLSREMPVEDAVDVIGERMFHIHLKNVQLFKRSPAYRVCLLEEGDVHIPRLLELLFKRGYRGDFTIESTLRGDRYWALKRDAAYIRLVHGRIERIVTKLVKPGNITQ